MNCCKFTNKNNFMENKDSLIFSGFLVKATFEDPSFFIYVEPLHLKKENFKNFWRKELHYVLDFKDAEKDWEEFYEEKGSCGIIIFIGEITDRIYEAYLIMPSQVIRVNKILYFKSFEC